MLMEQHGSCKIKATSDDLTSNTVKVEWKNYAYLSVMVNVSPQKVHVNDTVDVTVQITGDGYKMVGKPVTIMLDMDASSSLNSQSAADASGIRFDNAKIAANIFLDNLTGQDQVGLVSYGNYSNNVYWQEEKNITYNQDKVKDAITNLTMKSGVSGQSISLNQSVFEGANRIIGNPLYSTDDITAIITIGDSNYKVG